MRVPGGIKVCTHCSTEFQPTRIFQKYCAPKCAKAVYALRNPEKNKDSKDKYAEANREKHAVATEKYRKSNPGYYREYQSLRTRYVQQAKPSWLSEWEEFFISEFYDLAVKRKLHVDHIIPIKHPLVCGLHVPWNMQLLTPMQNFSKSNKFNPDDEDVICVFHEE